MRSRGLLTLMIVTLMASMRLIAAENSFTNAAARSDLTQGPGLAAKFKADAGISSNAAVIFADDFESGELAGRWDEQNTPKALSFAPVTEKVCGKRCLKVEARLGENQGGG